MKHIILLFAIIATCISSTAQKASLVVQNGHYKEALTISYSPSAKMVVTTAKDGYAIIYDVATGLQMARYQGLAGWVEEAHFTPDEKQLLTWGGSGKRDPWFMLWDISKNDTVWTSRKTIENADDIKISDDGKTFVVRDDEVFAAYDMRTGKKMSQVAAEDKSGSTGELWCIIPKSNKIVCENEDTGELLIVDPSTKTVDKRYPANLKKKDDGYVRCSFVSDDGRYYYRARNQRKWLKYDLTTGALVSETNPPAENFPSPNFFSLINKGKQLLVCDGWKITIYDTGTGEQVNEYTTDEEKLGYIALGDATNDGKQIVVTYGSEKTDLAFMDVRSGKVVRTFKSNDLDPYMVRFSHDGKKVLVAFHNRSYKLWNLQAVDGITSLPENTEFAEERPHNIRFSPDDKLLATAEQSGSIVDMDSMTYRKLETYFTDPDERLRISNGSWTAFDPSIEKIVIKNEQYKISPGKKICDFNDERSDDQYDRYYTPDGKYIYSFSSKFLRDSIRVMVFDTSSCSAIKTYKLPSYEIERGSSNGIVDVSQDGKYIVVAGNDITVAEMLTGKVIYNYPAHKRKINDKVVGFTDNFFPFTSVKFSPDGKSIALGYEEGLLSIFDLAAGKEKYIMKGHTEEITTMDYNPGGNLLVTAGEDGQVLLWNPQQGVQLVSLLMVGDNDYIVTTPDNYYMSTKNGLKAVAFRVKNRMFPVEQFDLRQNRPDTVLQRMGLASKPLIKMCRMAWVKRVKKAGYDPANLGSDFEVPELDIANKLDIPSTAQSPALSFEITASDAQYMLDRYNVYVNDVPIYGMNGTSTRNQKVKSIKKKVSLTLSKGTNKIQVSAVNEKGIESLRETFDVFYEGDQSKKPDLYVLAIGVSKYKDEKRSLKFASKDVSDLTNQLKIDNSKYEKVNIKTILDSDAKLDAVLKAKQFLAQAKYDDHVILYFSGHGLLDEQLNYYLALHDVDFNNPSAGGLPYDKFEGLIDSIPARSRLVFIDACHSGEVDKDDMVAVNNKGNNVTAGSRSGSISVMPKAGLKNSFDYMQALFTDVQKGTGATIISAAAGVEFALESKEWSNGVFTYSILEAMRDKAADSNSDGMIQVSELKTYVSRRVFELTNGAQRPTARKENYGNDFAIY
jgi:WD40 repeat protein